METINDWYIHPSGGGLVHKSVKIAKDFQGCISIGAVIRGGVISGSPTIAGGYITGGEISGNAVIEGGKIKGGVIRGGEIYGGEIWGGKIYGGEIWGGGIYGGEIYGGWIYGGLILGGLINGGKFCGGEICDGIWDDNPLFIVGSKYCIYIPEPGKIKIGCSTHTFDYWLKNYKRIGKEQGLSEKEIKEYGSYIKLFIERYGHGK